MVDTPRRQFHSHKKAAVLRLTKNVFARVHSINFELIYARVSVFY